MKAFINCLRDLSYKQLVVYLFVAFGSLIVLCSGFVSCAPPGEDTQLTSGSEGDEDEEEEEVEDCKGDDQCQYVCEKIYDESWRECSRESSETVSNLHRVFNRLRSDTVKRSKLDDISEGEGRITLDHFKKYLEVGADGWIRQIEGYTTDQGKTLDPYDANKANEVVEWLVENEKVAEILSNVGRGSDVLEELLKAAKLSGSAVTKCFWRDSTRKLATMTGETKFNSSGNTVKILEVGTSNVAKANFEIDGSRYYNLYDLLSCRGVSRSGGHDIFSLAADEGNEALFGVAFDLLDEVCRDSVLKSRESEKKAICRRAMMCVLAIQYNDTGGNLTANPDDVSKWDGWSYAKDQFSESSSGFDEDQACDVNDNEFGGNIDLD